MKKTYTVVFGPTWWEFMVSIDHNEETDKNIRSMVEFWAGWENHLSNNGGDYTKAFLQQLGREICIIAIASDFNMFGVIDEFKNREGWSPLDGTSGITLEEMDPFMFSHYDFEILDVPPQLSLNDHE